MRRRHLEFFKLDAPLQTDVGATIERCIKANGELRVIGSTSLIRLFLDYLKKLPRSDAPPLPTRINYCWSLSFS